MLSLHLGPRHDTASEPKEKLGRDRLLTCHGAPNPIDGAAARPYSGFSPHGRWGVERHRARGSRRGHGRGPPCPRMLWPASVGHRHADAADGHEAIAGVDRLEVAVEHQELDPRLQQPVAEGGGNELEPDREQATAREIAEGLVLAVNRVVILDAEGEREGCAHVERHRRVLEDGVARGQAETHVDPLVAVSAGEGLSFGLKGKEEARIKRDGAKPFRIVEAEVHLDIGEGIEGVVGTRVIVVGDARREDLPPGRR